MKRLRAAGFEAKFTRDALLPDWWEPSCERDPSVLPELEFRIAQVLGLTLAEVRAVDAPLQIPSYPNAQLRNLVNIERTQVTPAVHAAMRIAGAAVRNLRRTLPMASLPSDPLAWRSELLQASGFPNLDRIVGGLWRDGVVVLHIEVLPVPKFQGMACLVGERPVVILGHDQDVPALLAFPLGHEAGHIANGDCTADAPIVDATDTNDGSDIERRADEYSFQVLNGQSTPHAIDGTTPVELAASADKIERALRVDSAHLLLAWARQHGNDGAYQIAQTAIRRSLYKRSQGGKATIRRHFDEHVNVADASEADRSLLRCLFLDPDRDAPVR